MARTIQVRNTFTEEAPYSYLSNPLTNGGTVIPVKNINTFTAGKAIQIGNTGEELAEILMLGTSLPSGTALLTTGTVRFNHAVDTPVYLINNDQFVFKKSESGTTGSATAIPGGTVSITPDNEYTYFVDTNIAPTDVYKVAERNSTSQLESEDSDWLTVTGYSFYSLAKLRERIKRKLFSYNFLQNDDQINDWINEWIETMNNVAIDVNQDYSLGTVDIAHGTAGLGTISASDFKEIRRIEFTTDGQSYYLASKIHVTDYIPNETFNATHPYYYMLGDNVFGKKPDTTAGTARITYYKMQPILVDETDVLPVSMQSYTKSFTDYGLAQAYYFDNKPEMGDRYLGMAQSGLETFKSQITPRSKTGPQYITLTDTVNAEEDSDLV